MILQLSPEQLETKDPNAEGVGPLLKDIFEGHLEIKLPSFSERLRLPKKLGFSSMKDLTDESADVLGKLEMVATCSEEIRANIVGVQIKHLPSGAEIKTVDDLYDNPVATDLVLALCMKFISGFSEKKT